MDQEQLTAKFKARRDLYVAKCQKAAAYELRLGSEPSLDHSDSFRNCAQAIEWLASECGIDLPSVEETT